MVAERFVKGVSSDVFIGGVRFSHTYRRLKRWAIDVPMGHCFPVSQLPAPAIEAFSPPNSFFGSD
jgi:hypothetical protein